MFRRAWAIGGGTGPVIGGSLAQQGGSKWCVCSTIFMVIGLRVCYLISGVGYSVSATCIVSHLVNKVSLSLLDLNLPICGLAAILVAVFMNMRTPRVSWREKLAQLDWM